MISTRYLTTQFGSRYLGSSRIAIPDFLPTRAEIVDGQPALRKDTLYLCTQEDVIEDRIPECDGQTVLLICGCGQGFKASLIPEECVGLMLSCPLTEALNFTLRLSGIETDYTDRLQMLIAGGGNAHQFVSEIAMIAGGDTILLDEKLRVIFTSELRLGGLLKTSLSKDGQIPVKLAEDLLLNPHRYKGNVGVSTFSQYGTSVFATRSTSPEGMSVTLLLEIPSKPGMDVFGLMNNVHRMMKNWLFSGGFDSVTKIYTSFQKCWDKIRLGDAANNSELRDIFAKLPHPIKGDICIAVMTLPAGRNIPFNYILAKLRNMDPDVNVAVDKNDIVMVLPHRLIQTGVRSTAFEQNENLSELLEDFDASLMYGNYTRKPSHIKDVFYLTKKALVIARRIDPDRRIFFYEDFASYCAIDIAAQNYLRADIKQDAYMLINPAVLDLAIHDKETGDDLRDVLFYYLTCERNVKKTAETMHMHRNTVLNKLKKIEGMIDVDLEDYQLRQRLIFSSQFINYYDNVLAMPLPIRGDQDA